MCCRFILSLLTLVHLGCTLLQFVQVKASKTAKKATVAKFIVECSEPVDEGVFNTKEFEKFLHDRIKVNGKAGNLGTKVNITREKNKVIVNAELPFSKRYLKYLSKKYLKKVDLLDFLRVVATSKGAYEMKFYKSGAPAEE